MLTWNTTAKAHEGVKGPDGGGRERTRGRWTSEGLSRTVPVLAPVVSWLKAKYLLFLPADLPDAPPLVLSAVSAQSAQSAQSALPTCISVCVVALVFAFVCALC